jgi:phosphatidylglycerophosphate synthase
VLNFLTLGLGSVILFATGREFLGLLTAVLMAAIDYVDGTVARARSGNTKKGQYLDTSLDWLYLMLLIGGISYHHNILLSGYLALVAIVFSNWVQYNGNVEVKLPSILGIKVCLVVGILFGRTDLGILAIAIIQWVKTTYMYLRSIKK